MASLIHVFRDRTPFRVICRQVSDIQQSADPMEMNLVANSLISGSFHASARYAQNSPTSEGDVYCHANRYPIVLRVVYNTGHVGGSTYSTISQAEDALI